MTALVWIRRDLRIRDNVALRAALDEADERVVPVFCFDERLYSGRHASGPRTQFLLESLASSRGELRDRGGELFIRHGKPEVELPKLAKETGASAVHFAYDVSPFARKRGERTHRAFARRRRRGPLARGAQRDRRPRRHRHQAGQALHGLLAVPPQLGGDRAPRRARGAAARSRLPSGPNAGKLPSLESLGLEQEVERPARPAARRRRARGSTRFLDSDVADVLRQPRRARPGPHLAPVALHALRLHLAAPDRGAAAGARARARRPSTASSAGATSTTTSSSTSRATRARSTRTATAARSSGATPRRPSRRGARAGPATRWSTPGCASSWPRAGCTTGRASWSARS